MSRTALLPLGTTAINAGSGSQSIMARPSPEPTTSFGFGGGVPDFTVGTMAGQREGLSSTSDATRISLPIAAVALLVLFGLAYTWKRKLRRARRLADRENDKQEIISSSEDNDVTAWHTGTCGPGRRSSTHVFTAESPSRLTPVSLATSPSTPTGCGPPTVRAADATGSDFSRARPRPRPRGAFSTEILQTSATLDVGGAMPMPGAVDSPDSSDPDPVDARRMSRHFSQASFMSDTGSAYTDAYPSTPHRPGSLVLWEQSLISSASASRAPDPVDTRRMSRYFSQASFMSDTGSAYTDAYPSTPHRPGSLVLWEQSLMSSASASRAPDPVDTRRLARQFSQTSCISDTGSTNTGVYSFIPSCPGAMPLCAQSLKSSSSELSAATQTDLPHFFHSEPSTTPTILAETDAAISALQAVDKEHYDLVQVTHSDGPLTFDLHFNNATITFLPPATTTVAAAASHVAQQPYHVHVGRLVDASILPAVQGLDMLSIPIAVSLVSDCVPASDVVFGLDQVLMCDARPLRVQSSGAAVVLLSLRSSRHPMWSVSELSDGDLHSEPPENGGRHWHRIPEASFGCYIIAALPRAELDKHRDGIPAWSPPGARQAMLGTRWGNAPIGVGARGGGGQGHGRASESTRRNDGNRREHTGGSGVGMSESALATRVDALRAAKQIRLLLFVPNPPLLDFCDPPPDWLATAYVIWKHDEASKHVIESMENKKLFYIHTDKSRGSLWPDEEALLSFDILPRLRPTYKFDPDWLHKFGSQDIEDRQPMSVTLEMLREVDSASHDLEFKVNIKTNIDATHPEYTGLMSERVTISCSSPQRINRVAEYEDAPIVPVQEETRPTVGHDEVSLSATSEATLTTSHDSRDTSSSTGTMSAGTSHQGRQPYGFVDEVGPGLSDAPQLFPVRIHSQSIDQPQRVLVSRQATSSPGTALQHIPPVEEVGPEVKSGRVRRHSHRRSPGSGPAQHDEVEARTVDVTGGERFSFAMSEVQATRGRSQSRRCSAYSARSESFPYTEHGDSDTSSLVLSNSSLDRSTSYRLVPLSPVADQAGGHVALHQMSSPRSRQSTTTFSSAGGVSSRSLSARSLATPREEPQLPIGGAGSRPGSAGMSGSRPGSAGISGSPPIRTIEEEDSAGASPMPRHSYAQHTSPMPRHSYAEHGV